MKPPQNGVPVLRTVSGDGPVLFDPGPSNRVRLTWMALKQVSGSGGAAATVCSAYFIPRGSSSADPLAILIPPLWPMSTFDVYSHTTVRESLHDYVLILNLSVAASIYVNFDVEVF